MMVQAEKEAAEKEARRKAAAEKLAAARAEVIYAPLFSFSTCDPLSITSCWKSWLDNSLMCHLLNSLNSLGLVL